ncbi:hypothetical protein D3C72_1550280 [compost metagenome]
MADGRNDAALFPDAGDGLLQGDIAWQVEHRALAADHQHALVVGGTKLFCGKRGSQLGNGLLIGKQRGIECFGGVVLVCFHGTAAGACHVDGKAVALEDQPGLGELVHLETGTALALVAALAADHQQHARRLWGRGGRNSGQRQQDQRQHVARVESEHARLSWGVRRSLHGRCEADFKHAGG